MYDNQPVERGAAIRIDDDATIMFTRSRGLRLLTCGVVAAQRDFCAPV
jgi:hypothetical protein